MLYSQLDIGQGIFFGNELLFLWSPFYFVIANRGEATTYINSLWPSDVIWRQGSGSTLAQVMACCLTAPSHYMNQCWLIISKVQRYSSDGSLIKDTSIENCLIKIPFKSSRGQWVKINHWNLNKMAFCRRYLQTHLIQLKLLYIDSNFIYVYS